MAWALRRVVPSILALTLAGPLANFTQAQSPPFPEVLPGYELSFPHDEGSHDAFRLEWWYVTGWLDLPQGAVAGFQVTFFRARPAGVDPANPSRFNPTQILIAHAALSDPAIGKLVHDQRLGRAGFDLAVAKTHALDVAIGAWSLKQDGERYLTRIDAAEFRLNLAFARTQPPLVNGERGVSRKGPDPLSASYYYSIPQLAVSGSIERQGRVLPVSGRAWFDHEWSSRMMDPRAVGWDWTGINFDDGAALMAFRMRDASGATFWAGGTYRDARGAVGTLSPNEIAFTPARRWTSPKTGASYPVAMRLRAGALELTLEPLLDDQELDSRPSSRAVYWEGAVRVSQNARTVGRGYLELTGYAQALKLE